MTGHDIIKQLREMEQKATTWEGVHGERLVDVEFLNALYADRELLLSIAEAFRSGDAEILTWMLTGDGDFDDIDDKQPKINDLLSRLQAAAERLEESQITADEINRLAKQGTTGEAYYRWKE